MLAGSLWILLLLAVSSALPRLVGRRRARFARPWLVIALVALLVRLVPNLILSIPSNYDIESYQVVADLLLQGKEVYAETAGANRHPYLPFQMYWMALARWLGGTNQLSFARLVRLAPIGADVGIALLLWMGLKRKGHRAALLGGLLYALNPIAVLVSAYHGQFDAIPALLTLLAFCWLDRSAWAAGGWLGLGILSKSWPVLALPSLLAATRGWPGRLRLLAAALVVPTVGMGLYACLYGANLSVILTRSLGYNWGIGIWGYTYLARLPVLLEAWPATSFRWLVSNGRYLTLAALAVVWLLRARKQRPLAGFLTVLASLFAVTHAFSIQYLVWLVPVALFNQDNRWLQRYTVAAIPYMLVVYTGLIWSTSIEFLLPLPQADWFIITPLSLPAWLVTVFWAGSRLIARGDCSVPQVDQPGEPVAGPGAPHAGQS